MFIGEERRVGKRIDRPLADHQSRVVLTRITQPRTLGPPGAETREPAAVLQLEAAEISVRIEMREHRSSITVDPDTSGEPFMLQQRFRNAAFMLEIRMTNGI